MDRNTFQQTLKTATNSIQAILGELREVCHEDSEVSELRATMLGFLRETGHLVLTMKVEVDRGGCYCRGAEHYQHFERDTLEDMGKVLAQHRERYDVGKVRWSLQLSEDESDVLRAAYNAGRGIQNQILDLELQVKSARKEYEAAKRAYEIFARSFGERAPDMSVADFRVEKEALTEKKSASDAAFSKLQDVYTQLKSLGG